MRLRYADVMSTLAVFVALGGTSYAAIELSRNSIRSGHIKDGQVRTRDLARAAVGSAQVRDGSIGARDLAPGSLRQGPAGPPGAAGAPGERGVQGEPGPAGPSEGYTRAFSSVPLSCPFSTFECSGSVALPDLPPGAYAVRAKLEVHEPGTGGQRTLHCTLTAGGRSDSGAASVHARSDGTTTVRSAMLPLEVLATLEARSSATLSCESRGDFPPTTRRVRITAVRLGRVARDD